MLTTPEERHAFIIGLSEVLCPWPPRYTAWPQSEESLATEYHYYTAGRAVGFLLLLTLSIGVAKLFWR